MRGTYLLGKQLDSLDFTKYALFAKRQTERERERERESKFLLAGKHVMKSDILHTHHTH